MSDKTSEDRQLWDRLVESHMAFVKAAMEFLSGDVDRISLLRNALRGKERTTALYIAPQLSVGEKQALFREWLFLASFDHGALHRVREIILSLPRDWVLANIENETADLLNSADSLEYRRFLELYLLLDSHLALRLAKQANTHRDKEIRETGEEFLEKINGSR